MRELNLDHLRTFAEVVQLGSFSAAAQRLSLSQPAVSLQVRELERRLGARLIERVGRRATTTPAGADLLAHVARIDAEVAAAREAVAAHAAGVTGRVRMACGSTMCAFLLPPILTDLRRRFPALEIVVANGNFVEVLRLVEDNVLDLALVTMPVPGRMFEVTPLVDDAFAAVFAAADTAPAEVGPAALADRPLILYEPSSATRRLQDAWFETEGVRPKPVLELGSVGAMKELIAAGQGCGLLPRMAVTGRGARADLTIRPLTPRLTRQWALVMRRDKPLNRGLREVVKALETLRGA
jgi:DNA-binding transcriptional LysR family regulator